MFVKLLQKLNLLYSIDSCFSKKEKPQKMSNVRQKSQLLLLLLLLLTTTQIRFSTHVLFFSLHTIIKSLSFQFELQKKFPLHSGEKEGIDT
jgi:hypothetical protein